MPKYLFTSDLRISELPNRIFNVATILKNGGRLSDIEDKSNNNNAATLAFYFGLQPNSEIVKEVVLNSPIVAIRNFILKFQFPNVRTRESYNDAFAEEMLFAPYRVVITLLYKMAERNNNSSHLSFGEILFYLFCNPSVYRNPEIDYSKLISSIEIKRQHLPKYNYKKDIDSIIEWNQYERQSREFLTVLKYVSDCFRVRNEIVYFSMNNSSYEDDKDFIQSVIDYNYLWVPSQVNNFQQAQIEYFKYMDTMSSDYTVLQYKSKNDNVLVNVEKGPLQQIFFGAPGTGKSHKVKEVTDTLPKENVFRTTFHPDSDYSTFVGAYKPKKKSVYMRDVTGKVIEEIVDGVKKEVTEDKIIYDYTPQALLKAYVRAWELKENWDKAETDEERKNNVVFLVIEEINRGNCAQVFGDMFQLLDRNEDGMSDYAVKPDTDIENYLVEKLGELYNPNEGMRLPSNLYIWATMNTSDQSLFPIDSAFKRRWDWKYIPIADAKKNYIIEIDGDQYDWWNFLTVVNSIIENTTHSEDKKLGYFFAKDKNGVITADTFVSKVIFYLWNDVFKDNDISHDAFKDDKGDLLAFHRFFLPDGSVNTNVVIAFLNKLGVSPYENTNEETTPVTSSAPGTKRKYDKTRYRVNNIENLNKAQMTREAFRLYIEAHPDADSQTIAQAWNGLGINDYVQHLVETDEEFIARTEGSSDSNKRATAFDLQNGEKIYLSTQFGIDNVGKFMEAVNNAGWNIRIETMPEKG